MLDESVKAQDAAAGSKTSDSFLLSTVPKMQHQAGDEAPILYRTVDTSAEGTKQEKGPRWVTGKKGWDVARQQIADVERDELHSALWIQGWTREMC